MTTKPGCNVYKFATTYENEDSIRWDVACAVDLWVSSASWPPLRAVTSSITILDPSIFRSVERKPGTLVRVFVPFLR